MMQPERRTKPQAAGQPTCRIDDILSAISEELVASAKRCTEIQWVISDLLEKAHHPNLSEEMHVLQDIDRIQQTLEDIAHILTAAAEPTEGVSFAREKLVENLKLDSLRSRIFQSLRTTDADQAPVGESSEITWL